MYTHLLSSIFPNRPLRLSLMSMTMQLAITSGGDAAAVLVACVKAELFVTTVADSPISGGTGVSEFDTALVPAAAAPAPAVAVASSAPFDTVNSTPAPCSSRTAEAPLKDGPLDPFGSTLPPRSPPLFTARTPLFSDCAVLSRSW